MFFKCSNLRVGIRLPTVEVRFQNLTVEADSYIGSRALPTLPNVALNIAESALGLFGISTAKRTKLTILKNVSGIIKPSRYHLHFLIINYFEPSSLGLFVHYYNLGWCNVTILIVLYRMALLLGPPSSGKTTLLLALAGKLDNDLRVHCSLSFS